jgi:hypothetical protein
MFVEAGKAFKLQYMGGNTENGQYNPDFTRIWRQEGPGTSFVQDKYNYPGRCRFTEGGKTIYAKPGVIYTVRGPTNRSYSQLSTSAGDQPKRNNDSHLDCEVLSQEPQVDSHCTDAGRPDFADRLAAVLRSDIEGFPAFCDSLFGKKALKDLASLWTGKSGTESKAKSPHRPKQD